LDLNEADTFNNDLLSHRARRKKEA
jgi:hypothetical protein